MIAQSPCDVSTIFRWVYIGYHKLFVSFQYLSSGDVPNTTTLSDLIWTQISLLMGAVKSGSIEYASMIKLSEVQLKYAPNVKCICTFST